MFSRKAYTYARMSANQAFIKYSYMKHGHIFHEYSQSQNHSYVDTSTLYWTARDYLFIRDVVTMVRRGACMENPINFVAYLNTISPLFMK